MIFSICCCLMARIFFLFTSLYYSFRTLSSAVALLGILEFFFPVSLHRYTVRSNAPGASLHGRWYRRNLQQLQRGSRGSRLSYSLHPWFLGLSFSFPFLPRFYLSTLANGGGNLQVQSSRRRETANEGVVRGPDAQRRARVDFQRFWSLELWLTCTRCFPQAVVRSHR